MNKKFSLLLLLSVALPVIAEESKNPKNPAEELQVNPAEELQKASQPVTKNKPAQKELTSPLLVVASQEEQTKRDAARAAQLQDYARSVAGEVVNGKATLQEALDAYKTTISTEERVQLVGLTHDMLHRLSAELTMKSELTESEQDLRNRIVVLLGEMVSDKEKLSHPAPANRVSEFVARAPKAAVGITAAASVALMGAGYGINKLIG